MTKKLYFCETNGYNMVVSEGKDGECRYLTETEDFPYIVNMGYDDKRRAAEKFLATVEDDSSWESDCSREQIFTDDVDVLVEIEKEL